MKGLLFIIPCTFLIACSGEGEEEKSTSEILEEMMEENEVLETDFEEKDPPEPGSTKEILLGVWFSDSSDIETHLSKDRYISYVDGRKNWDNDWELSSGEELTDDNIDDNGTFIHVISKDSGEPFYSLEIKSLDETHLHAQVAGSSGDGLYDHIYWSRTSESEPLDSEETSDVNIGW